MADNDKRTDSPANMRITLRYQDVNAFVEKFAANVSRGGIFIASRAPKPVGTQVRFELLLADGKSRVLKGEGAVAWVRLFDPRQPNRPHGMGIKFARLDAESRKVVDRILALKKERGIKEDTGSIPLPPVAQREDSLVTLPPSPPTEPPAAAPAARPDTAPTPAPSTPPVAEGSAPRRLPDMEVSVAEVEALLAADGPALEATLTRALAIARASGGDAGGIEELEALLRQPPPPTPTSVADAVAGLASMFGGGAPAAKTAPAAEDDGFVVPTVVAPAAVVAASAQTAPELPPEPTHEIVLEADPPDADLDDTGPISISRIVAAASTEPAAPRARSPFAAEDLGAGDLDPLDLEGLELDSARAEIEPLPPPPHSAPHFRLDPGLEDTGAGQEPAPAAAAPPPPVPEPLDEEIEISGPDYSGFEDDGERTILTPLPAALLEAEPPISPTADVTPKPEKKGFFSKLFNKK